MYPLFFLLVMYACSKMQDDKPGTAPAGNVRLSVDEARNYYNSKFKQTIGSSTNLRHKSPDIFPMYPRWKNATTFSKGEFSYVEVPTAFTVKKDHKVKIKSGQGRSENTSPRKPVPSLQRLLISKNSRGEVSEMYISYVPDSAYFAASGYDISHNSLHQLDPSFCGYVIYSRSNNIPLFITKVEQGKFLGTALFRTSGEQQARQAPDSTKLFAGYECWEYCVEHWEQDCWAVPDPLPGQPPEECGEPYMTGETCTYECFYTMEDLPEPDNPASYDYPGGGEGGSASYFPYMGQYLVYAPSNPVNINEFLKCFNKSLGAKFTIYSDQPMAGSRAPIGVNVNGSQVGHAFVTIEQTIGGVTFSRSFGFYPAGESGLLDPQDNSAFSNDGGQLYDVKLSTNISANQLTSIINKANAANNVHYNLYLYNCANFAIDLANIAGLNIPYSKGMVFPGCNPGDLGEDLRALPSSVRTSGVAPSKSGNCN